MIENVSTQLTVFHCFAHCLLPGRAFASLYALLFLEKEAEIGGRDQALAEARDCYFPLIRKLVIEAVGENIWSEHCCNNRDHSCNTSV